jgi:site-specific DNA-methyltransferase (adenine-specific)
MSETIAVPTPREIAELATPEDAKALYDKLEALAQYAKRYQLDADKQNKIAEAKLRTAREGGKMLAETVGHSGGSPSHAARDLPEDFTWSMSSRWQALASIPEDEWEKSIAHAKATPDDELTLVRMLRRARELQLGGRQEKREAAARAQISASASFVVADVRTWRPASVDAIITDPPYVGDSIPLYEALRDFALEVLPQGGPLVVMTWQAILPDVLDALKHDDLAYRWTLSWRFDNVGRTADHARRVFDCWKPILVFHKGEMPWNARMVTDAISSDGPSKLYHSWGQGLTGFESLVRSFAEPDGTVCDPFLGAGTTALAAVSQGRNFIGCDIDPLAVEIAESRLVYDPDDIDDPLNVGDEGE